MSGLKQTQYQWIEGQGTPAKGFLANGDQTILVIYPGKSYLTTGRVNVRFYPPSGRIICTLPTQTKVTIFDIRDDWGRSDLGWMSMHYLQEIKELE